MSSIAEASAGTVHAVSSLLPVWAIPLQLAGSLAVYLAGKKSEKARNTTAITILTFLLVTSMYPQHRQRHTQRIQNQHPHSLRHKLHAHH